MPEGSNSAYDVGRGLSQAFPSGGPLFPVAFSVIASGGILFVNSDKKYAKSAARDQWSLDSLYSQEFRLLWAIKGIGAATDPLPLPAQAKKMMRLPPEHTDSPR